MPTPAGFRKAAVLAIAVDGLDISNSFVNQAKGDGDDSHGRAYHLGGVNHISLLFLHAKFNEGCLGDSLARG
jgi:hypothetical protein